MTCSLCANRIRKGRVRRFAGARAANRHAPGKCRTAEPRPFGFISQSPAPVLTHGPLVRRTEVM